MRILKSLQAGVLERPFSYNGRHYLSVSVLWGFRLDDNSAILEAEMWQRLGTLLSEGRIFDQGMPKERAEFLCAANFHAPGGQPVHQAAVSARVGDREKRLLISGPRRWRYATASRPEPISTLPIRYSYAFGGDDFPDNPTGMGYAADTETGEHPLPCIEYPAEAVTSPSQTPSPASLEGRDLRWRPRQRYTGTYDEKYMRTRMPGLPDDIDWRVFNDAAEDQWFAEYLRGDEPFELVHLHREKARLSGTLPGVTGRAFIERRREPSVKESAIDFQEVALRLDTVWLVPDSEMGVLIHRGTTEVQEDDATDVVRLLVAHENLNGPQRQRGHYRDEMRKRSDPDTGYRYMLDTRPLIPAGYTCAIQETMASPEGARENLAMRHLESFSENQKNEGIQQADSQVAELENNISTNNAELPADARSPSEELARAKTTVATGAEKSAQEQRLTEIIEKIIPGATTGDVDITRADLGGFDDLNDYVRQVAEEKNEEAKRTTRKQLEELRHQNDPETEGVTATIEKLEAMLADQSPPPPLPRPSFDAQLEQLREQIAALEQYQEELQAAGVSPLEVESALPDMELMRTQLAEAEREIRDQYPTWAHLVGESSSPHPGEETNRRLALLQTVRGNGGAAGGDYAFVDLSGVTITDADLSGSLLEYVDLSGATLRSVNLEGAVLAKAKLANCRFENVNLKRANVGSAAVTGATFVDCDFTEGWLSRSDIRKTRFERCRLEERMEMFLETRMHQVAFVNCSMPKTNFIEADFRDCDFCGSDLTGATFVKSDLTHCNFSGATLVAANIISTRAPGARFDRAIMKNCRFVDEPILNDCSFNEADATMANFRSSDLAGASFFGAVLDQSDFSGSDLQGVMLDRISAIGTQFRKANLRGASLFQADLREASLMKATVASAGFKAANLYSVSFLYSTLGETDFSGANLDNTILKDWRPIR